MTSAIWQSAFEALAQRSVALAEQYRDEGCLQAATARERFAMEIRAELRRLTEEELSVQTAASESGFTEEHVRRLLRVHPELNCGRKGKPKVRRGDLPVKTALARRKLAAYDPVADARSLSRQGV